MDYPADPGGIFASDVHRRVCAAIPPPATEFGDAPLAAKDLPERLAQCEVGVTWSECAALLQDLVDSGDAELIEGELVQRTEQGHTKLHGPIADEPEPKAGDELKRAEGVNKDLDKADRQLEAEAKDKRRAELQEELAALGEEK
jgi:hypothetical protein